MATEAQIKANRLNALKGGRKKGLATIEREKAKDYIANHIAQHMPALFEMMLNKALDGDMMAARELFDRGFGRAVQALEHSGKDGNPLIIQLSEVIARKNDLNTGSK
jgi:hypothetical protein